MGEKAAWYLCLVSAAAAVDVAVVLRTDGDVGVTSTAIAVALALLSVACLFAYARAVRRRRFLAVRFVPHTVMPRRGWVAQAAVFAAVSVTPMSFAGLGWWTILTSVVGAAFVAWVGWLAGTIRQPPRPPVLRPLEVREKR